MANYEVIRIHKHKSRAGIVRSLKHCYREQDTPNADPEKTPENDLIDSKNTKEAMEKYSERINGLDRKVRKNAVHAVEFVITASPDKMSQMSRKEQDKFFEKSMKFLEGKHGKENIFSSAVHRDETTPHLSVFVVPITKENKLSCKSFYGERNALRDLQTNFHKQVGRKFEMNRGVEKSGATHLSIKDYYTRIQSSEITNKNLSPKVLESKKDFGNRVLQAHGSFRDKYIELAHKHNETLKKLDNVTKDRDKIKELLNHAVKDFRLKGMTDKYQEKLHNYALGLEKEQKLEQEKEKVIQRKKPIDKGPKKSIERTIPFKGL